MSNKNNSVPEVSIDEALELYLSIACPNGLPEGEEKDKILSLMKDKIAKDRPEWTKFSENTSRQIDEETPNRYAEIKAQIVEQANREDIPEDSEERYLYNRRKEAKQNSNKKNNDEKETQQKDSLRNGLIERKKSNNEETLKRAALIKKAILEKSGQRLSPQFESLSPVNNDRPELKNNQRPATGFSDTAVLNTAKDYKTLQHQKDSFDYDKYTDDEHQTEDKPDADKWFNDFKTLSMDDRAESIKEFNMRKRGMLQTREDVMWSRRPSPKSDYGFSLDDDGFDMDTGLSFESDKKSSKGFRVE